MPSQGAVLSGPVGPVASTQVAAVLGDPIAHSLSPAIHNAAFRALDLDWVYVALRVGRGGGAAAVSGVRALGLGGASVTMPLKEEVLGHLDDLTPTAAALGAVNCLFWDEGRLVGDNTDGGGLVDALAWEHGIDPAGRRCVVLGAGGAARSVVAALAAAGASEVAVVARTPDRAERAAALAAAVGSVRALDVVAEASIVVNATPVGMAAHPGTPCDPALVAADAVAVDLVYHPTETAWLAALRSRGVRCGNGVGMLVGQAARQFERWTGARPPLDAMVAAAGLPPVPLPPPSV